MYTKMYVILCIYQNVCYSPLAVSSAVCVVFVCKVYPTCWLFVSSAVCFYVWLRACLCACVCVCGRDREGVYASVRTHLKGPRVTAPWSFNCRVGVCVRVRVCGMACIQLVNTRYSSFWRLYIRRVYKGMVMW